MWATEFSCRSQIIYVILNWEAGCQLELCAVPSPVIVCLECSLSTVSAILRCQVWWWFLLGMSSVQLLEWLPSESTPSSNTAVRAWRPLSFFFVVVVVFWALLSYLKPLCGDLPSTVCDWTVLPDLLAKQKWPDTNLTGEGVRKFAPSPFCTAAIERSASSWTGVKQ